MPNLTTTKTGLSTLKRAAAHRMVLGTPAKRTVILLDTSGSMATFADGDRDRLDVALDALRAVVPTAKGPTTLLQFNDKVRHFTLEGRLPQAAGSTYILQALQAAMQTFPKPSQLFLISDGEPTDNKHDILAYARTLGIPIFTYGVGPGTHQDFLDELAHCTGGTHSSDATDMKFLQQTLTKLLITSDAGNGIAL